MEERVGRYIAAHGLLTLDDIALVGVSGGVDSMALLDLLRRLGYPVVVGHVDHGLRASARQDTELVAAYCDAHGIPLRQATLDPAAKEGGQSLLDWARGARYAALERMALDAGASVVAVAHHLNDQAETVLLNLFRGAGPVGLAAMPPRRAIRPGSDIRLIRPLLDVSRADLVAYAETHDLAWRDDPTNNDLSRRRALLRHSILPAIRDGFGDGVDRVLVRNAEVARALLDALETGSEKPVRIDAAAPDALAIEPLRGLDEGLRRHTLLSWLARVAPRAPRTRAAAVRLDALLDAQPGRRVEFQTTVIRRGRDRLFAAGPHRAQEERPVEIGSPIMLREGRLTIEEVGRGGVAFDPAPYLEFADADQMEEPLWVRSWKEGDRFRPLGGAGSRRVSRFLADCKAPVHRKRDVLVLTSGDRIVWVVGYRLDERVRVTERTRRVLRLRFEPAGPADEATRRVATE